MAKRHGKIVLLTNIPTPYRIPVFNCLARLLRGDLSVVFLARAEARRPWSFAADKMQFDWALLSDGACQAAFLSEAKTAVAMLATLVRERPRAVICSGYNSLAAWVALLWCKLFGRRFVFWLESTARDERPRGRLRLILKKLFVSNSDAVAASGRASAQYVRDLGAPPEQIFLAPFGGDVEAFARDAAQVDAAQEKRRLGFPSQLILFSGRLVRSKGVFVLLGAFRRIARELPNAGLLVVGDGPERQALESLCKLARLNRVFFVGAQDYPRMPYFFALADLLVLPTFSDPWGFVVNEAFACGIPAVVSRVAGACDDLIVDGKTGFVVKPGDGQELAEKILKLLRHDALRAAMGARCRKLIENFTAEASAKGLFVAAQAEIGNSAAGASALLAREEFARR